MHETTAKKVYSYVMIHIEILAKYCIPTHCKCHIFGINESVIHGAKNINHTVYSFVFYANSNIEKSVR